jgi:hypothetical protein
MFLTLSETWPWEKAVLRIRILSYPSKVNKMVAGSQQEMRPSLRIMQPADINSASQNNKRARDSLDNLSGSNYVKIANSKYFSL